jgi:hypothetical protein
MGVAFVFDKYSTAAPPCSLWRKVELKYKSQRIKGSDFSKRVGGAATFRALSVCKTQWGALCSWYIF